MFTDKVTGNDTFGGSSATVTVSGNGVTINPNRKHLRIWGNGALRSGAILDTASAIEAEEHSIIGHSWGVGFDVTNIVGVSALTVGNSSGQSSSVSVKFDAALTKWFITSNVITP